VDGADVKRADTTDGSEAPGLSCQDGHIGSVLRADHDTVTAEGRDRSGTRDTHTIQSHMTDLSSPAAGADQLELKLRGLERLRTAGVVGGAEYERLRAKLLADAPGSMPASAPGYSPAAPAAPLYSPPSAAPTYSPPPAATNSPPPAATYSAPVAPTYSAPPAAPQYSPPAEPVPVPAYSFGAPAAPTGGIAPPEAAEPVPAYALVPAAPAPAQSAGWAIRSQAPDGEPAAATPVPPYAAPVPTSPSPWPAGPATDAQLQQKGRRSPIALIAGIVALALVVGGTGAYVALGRKQAPAASNAVAPTATASATPSPSSSASKTYATIADFVPDAKAFVEQHRGLTWKSDVTVTGLDDAAFTAKLLGGKPVTATGAATADDPTTRDFKALHLIPQSTDLGSSDAAAATAGVVGFYDYNTKELYVRGTQPTPYVRQVVVHELTHALQDQWFGLARLYEKNDVGGESVEAFTAVVEGDARRIENEYADSLPADQKQQAQTDGSGTPQQQQQLDTLPTALLLLFDFPYGAGLQFDQALVTDRGQSALDAAFRSPPTTTAEILDPQRYTQDIRPFDVPLPPAAGTVYDQGMLGALGLAMMFEGLVSSGQMTQSQPLLDADYWGGDSYVAYSSGGRSCLRDTVVAFDAQAQSALDVPLKLWLNATPAASLTSGRLDGSGPVTFTACSG
jgi:hypothetical protein